MTGDLGAIACGHPATAAAAREILEDGGNAFDAALAAFCMASVAEPVLCSLGGGGFLLARRADGEAMVYDFFVQTPRRARPVSEIDFYPILADFGTATQEFHIGLGAIATPGAIKGLFAVHADLASLPMARLVEPAARVAREGLRLRPIDSYLYRVVGPILAARPEGRVLFTGSDGMPLEEDGILRQPAAAEMLETLAREGQALFYHGDLGRRLVADCREQGGQLSAEDLAGYRVVKRPPLRRSYRDSRILTNPPPSSGGILIAFALELLAQTEIAEFEFGSMEHIGLLLRVMELTNKARVESRLQDAVAEAEDAEAVDRLFDPALLARYAAEVLGRPSSLRGTTHISVVDAAGNIAALSTSNGEGCGYILPDSGMMLNNMLGEEDLSPHGFHAWPKDSRMSSMMSPTLADRADGSVVAMGSGGSNRIRTAILQVLVNLVDFDLPTAAAVEAPRVHFETGIANLEGGLDATVALPTGGERIVRWPRHNLFFGGVHVVGRDSGGRFSAAGDPRRGGASLIV